MKKVILFAALSLAITSCETGKPEDRKDEANESTMKMSMASLTVDDEPVFIPKDTANRMIESFLNSVPVPERDSSLASLIINADSLRAYLNDTSLHITNLKIMLAHTLEYTNSKDNGRYAGYRYKALTAVLAGYNSSGNYVYFNGNGVMDNCGPCPDHCPTIGTAQGNYFPQ